MREIERISRFKRDYRREKSGRHGKKLDALLLEILDLLAIDASLPIRLADHPLSSTWSGFRDCHVARSGADLRKAGRAHLAPRPPRPPWLAQRAWILGQAGTGCFWRRNFASNLCNEKAQPDQGAARFA